MCVPFHTSSLLSQGGNVFIGAGYGSFTGVVIIEFISIANVFMLGEYIANDGTKREKREGGSKERVCFGLLALSSNCFCSSNFLSTLFFPLPSLAGFIAWIASPIVEASAIEFSRTLGEVIYVGAGAMVVWATPLVEFYGPRVTRVSEFFVMVNEGTERRKGGRG